MHPGLRNVARFSASFPVFDSVVRYKLSDFENPRVIARLRRLKSEGRLQIVAVDLGAGEVLIGRNAKTGPAARSVIRGREVIVPR